MIFIPNPEAQAAAASATIKQREDTEKASSQRKFLPEHLENAVVDGMTPDQIEALRSANIAHNIRARRLMEQDRLNRQEEM